MSDHLTDVSGVGKNKADALYMAGYETVADLRRAGQEDLSDVDGIGNALAARIKADVGGLGTGDTLTLAEVVEKQKPFICPSCGEAGAVGNPVALEHADDLSIDHDCGCRVYHSDDPDPWDDVGVVEASYGEVVDHALSMATGNDEPHPAQAAGSGDQSLGDCPGCGATVTDADDDRIEDGGDVFCSVECYNEVEPW